MEHELLVLLAATMTKDQIIDRIQEEIDTYKEAVLIGNEDKITEKAHHLALACNLFIMNMVTDGSANGAMETIKKIQAMRQRDKLFTVDAKN